MLWFDYVYYRVYKVYLHKWNDTTPGLYACGVVSVMQSFLLVLAGFGIELLAGNKIWTSKFMIVGVILVILLLNYIRYSRFAVIDQLVTRWKQESKSLKARRGFFIILFIVIVVLSTIVVVHYAGVVNRGKSGLAYC